MKKWHGFFVRNPLFAALFLLAILGTGLATSPLAPDFWPQSLRIPVQVDAIPNLGENQQILFTSWMGQSPEDVEDQITYPLASQMMGIDGVKTVRTFSWFGFSTIYLIFDENHAFTEARARILEKLASLPPQLLPDGVRPSLGPDATGLGQVYQYALLPKRNSNSENPFSLAEISRLQEFQIRYDLQSVEGVSEVAGVGVRKGEFQITVDPMALARYQIVLSEVANAISQAGKNTSARTLEYNQTEYFLRGVGQAITAEDIGQTLIRKTSDQPVRLADIAEIQLVPEFSRGILDWGGQNVVGGIVTIRHDANPLRTLQKIHRKVAEINSTLPAKNGVQLQIVPFYDRLPVIEETVGTLNTALRDAVLITALVILILMGNFGGGFLVASVLPLGILATWSAMWAFEVDANIVALSGVAIAIGVMADVGIVLIESIQKQIDSGKTAVDAAIDGASEVTTPLMIAVGTTLLSFLPVFFLSDAEGKLFRPLAATKTLTILLALVVVLLLLPTLARYLLAPGLRSWNRLLRWPATIGLTIVLALIWQPAGMYAGFWKNLFITLLFIGGILGVLMLFQWLYPRILLFVLSYRSLFLIPVFLLVFSGITLWLGAANTLSWLPESLRQTEAFSWLKDKIPPRGSEFMPTLNEGSFLYMPTTMPHASADFIRDVLQDLDSRIASIPEVASAVGKAGRAETALDPAPLSMIETIVELRSEYSENENGEQVRNWRDSIQTAQDIWDEIVRVATIPGLTSAPFLQPIEGRIVMLQSGIRAPYAIRLKGDNLAQMEEFGLKLEKILKHTEGIKATSVFADRAVGKPYLDIKWRREDLLLAGLGVQAAQDSFRMAVSGQKAGEVIDGRERFDITLRYGKLWRNSPEDLAELPLIVPGGRVMHLRELADLQVRKGPQAIRGENSRLVSYVLFDKERHLSSSETIQLARKAIEGHLNSKALDPPPGIHWDFAGSWENQIRANQRLAVIIPIALIIIYALLSLMFGSLLQTLLLFSSVAVACSGGFWMLYLMDINLSVAVWVGFLALFGIATDDGVLISSYLKDSLKSHQPTTREELHEAILEAGKKRIRPCLMTTATTLLALLPIFLSTGRGSEIMQPMAIPIFGGMSVALITLFVVPVGFSFLVPLPKNSDLHKPL